MGYPRDRAATPIRHMLEHDPGRPPERPGEVRDGRAAADDQAEIGHHGCGVDKCIGPTIEIVPQCFDLDVRGQASQLIHPVPILQADQPDLRNSVCGMNSSSGMCLWLS
jgi:hypothetical protein